MRNDRERLLDILEAIERIEKYAEQGKARFESEELVQTWIVHHIEIIGEACRAMPMAFSGTLCKCPVGRYHRHAQHLDSPLFWYRLRSRLAGC